MPSLYPYCSLPLPFFLLLPNRSHHHHHSFEVYFGSEKPAYKDVDLPYPEMRSEIFGYLTASFTGYTWTYVYPYMCMFVCLSVSLALSLFVTRAKR